MEFRTITDQTGFLSHSWTHNGERIAFVKWVEERSIQVMGSMRADGSDFQTHLELIYGGVKCSPVRDQVAVTDSQGVHLYSLGTGEKITLPFSTYAGQFNEQDIAWSPDGEYLAFVTSRKDAHAFRGGFSQIYIVDKEGNIVDWVESTNSLGCLSWERHNLVYQELSYATLPISGGPMSLEPRQVDLSACHPRSGMVTLTGGSDFKMLWLEVFWFDHERGELDGKQLPICVYLEEDAWNSKPRGLWWSPDGNKLLFDRQLRTIDDNGQGTTLRGFGWHLFDVNSEQTETFIEEDPEAIDGKYRAPSWSPDSRQIAFLKGSTIVLVTV